MSDFMPWKLSGTYLEVCNCEAICPCRRIDGKPGGRSSYGECLGALSWRIESGRAGETELAGLQVILASRYHDDDPGSPWTYWIYLDSSADDAQRDALEQIYTGRLGGTPNEQFPWAFKESKFLGARPVEIEIDHTPGRGWFRAGGQVAVRVRAPVDDPATVTCIIPGHHRSGREVHSELIHVDDQPLEFELSDRCGYETTFDYSSG